jgi:hypothetical protein
MKSNNIEYPYIGIAEDDGAMVLFVSHCSGILINLESLDKNDYKDLPESRYYDFWQESEFNVKYMREDVFIFLNNIFL